MHRRNKLAENEMRNFALRGETTAAHPRAASIGVLRFQIKMEPRLESSQENSRSKLL
jgi:hypothetical protein